MSDKITRIIDAAWADLRPDISARIYGSLTAEWDARTGRGPHPDLSGLTPSERAEVDSLLGIAEVLWDLAHGAPPLGEDRVARALGFVDDDDLPPTRG